MTDNRVYIYDVTLRDGAQTQGVDFSAVDKIAIARDLDNLGVDYIEGGWPGANPTDDSFFADLPTLKNASFSAFGMTRRAGRSVENDPGLTALINSDTNSICMVGKTWDFHVDVALEIDRDENVAMVRDSIERANNDKSEIIFDAEHFLMATRPMPIMPWNARTRPMKLARVGWCYATPTAAPCHTKLPRS